MSFHFFGGLSFNKWHAWKKWKGCLILFLRKIAYLFHNLHSKVNLKLKFSINGGPRRTSKLWKISSKVLVWNLSFCHEIPCCSSCIKVQNSIQKSIWLHYVTVHLQLHTRNRVLLFFEFSFDIFEKQHIGSICYLTMKMIPKTSHRNCSVRFNFKLDPYSN